MNKSSAKKPQSQAFSESNLKDTKRWGLPYEEVIKRAEMLPNLCITALKKGQMLTGVIASIFLKSEPFRVRPPWV